MYSTTEIFNNDGIDLKVILKDCIYNYYLKNKMRNNLSGIVENIY